MTTLGTSTETSLNKLAALVELSSLHTEPIHDSQQTSHSTLSQYNIDNVNTVYKQQTEHIQSKIDALHKYIKQYTQLIDLLTQLQHKYTESILLPIVPDIAYIPATIIHTNEYTVNLGCNYYVEKTNFATIELLKRRITYVQSKTKILKDEIHRINDNINMHTLINQQDVKVSDDQHLYRTGMKNDDNDDIIEIRETYDSDLESNNDTQTTTHDTVQLNLNNNTHNNTTDFERLMQQLEAAELEEQQFAAGNDLPIASTPPNNASTNVKSDISTDIRHHEQHSNNNVQQSIVNNELSNDEFQAMWNNIQVPDDISTLQTNGTDNHINTSTQSAAFDTFDTSTVQHPGDIARLLERRSPRHANTVTNNKITAPSPKSAISKKPHSHASPSKKSVRFDVQSETDSNHTDKINHNNTVKSNVAETLKPHTHTQASLLPTSTQPNTYTAFSGEIVEHDIIEPVNASTAATTQPPPRISKFKQARLQQ